MTIEVKEKTALCTSVGADERQSVQNTISSISALDTEINHPDENSPENFEDIMRQIPSWLPRQGILPDSISIPRSDTIIA